MNDKEKKAVEIIKKEITRPYKTPLEVYITDIKMLLHLMEKQSKVIDEMARIFYKISKGEYVTIEKNIEIEEIRQYFYRKVSEEDD